MKNQMDIAESFARYTNRITLGGEYAVHTRNRNTINLDYKLWISIVDKLTVFIKEMCDDHNTKGVYHDMRLPENRSDIIYHKEVVDYDVVFAKVDYDFIYASRFSKAFVDEGYRTLPYLEQLYPLIYRVLTTHSQKELSEDSKTILRYVVNSYYEFHHKLETKYKSSLSPISALWDALGDLRTAPIVYMYIDTICFDVSKLGALDSVSETITDRLLGVDDVLYAPKRTTTILAEFDQETYDKTVKVKKSIISLDFK